MSKLHPTKDSRTTYDKKTGAVRSFFGAELVTPIPKAKKSLTPVAKSDDFLEVNRDLFNLKNISLRKDDVREGSASLSVRYRQDHLGIPVYGAQLVVGLRKKDGAVTSVVNAVDYEIPTTLTPDKVAISGEQAEALVLAKFASRFASLEIGKPSLYVYRHVADESVNLDLSLPAIRQAMLHFSTGTPGQVYLVWKVLMDTREPEGNWELLVDATDGSLIAVKDRRKYATRKGFVFWPDPIRSSQNVTLCSNTPESTLNLERKEVDLENLDSPINEVYKLDGSWVRCRDKEEPNFAPPMTSGDFKYETGNGAKKREFLCVMAYYYLDRLITDLRSLGVTAFNKAVTGPLDVDSQGCNGDDQSWFVSRPEGVVYIAHGEGGVPDASDPAVIVHEYGHAVHHFLASPQTYENEHIFCDFLAAGWVDRYNDHQFRREEVFPWDNNQKDEWSSFRRVDLIERYDDVDFTNYSLTLKGAIGATALWDWFLSIGGNSGDANKRRWAADEVIHTYMEMLVNAADKATTLDLIKGLIEADTNRTGGVYKKVIWDAFRRRGLWSDFTQTGNVDVYIDDAHNGGYDYLEEFWNCQDLVVRRKSTDSPTMGHEEPYENKPNYLWVRVKRKGTINPGTVNVETFHCVPGTEMVWPTHWKAMSPASRPATTLATAEEEWVGPFEFTPTSSNHACVLAIVEATNDPANAQNLVGSAPHWMLVPFDNNIAQRILKPLSNVLP